MYTQEIAKAHVWILPEARIYCPYSGRLTQKALTAMRERLLRYCLHHHLSGLPYGWKTKDVRIRWPEEGDSREAYYREDGAGGTGVKVYVCAEDY